MKIKKFMKLWYDENRKVGLEQYIDILVAIFAQERGCGSGSTNEGKDKNKKVIWKYTTKKSKTYGELSAVKCKQKGNYV